MLVAIYIFPLVNMLYILSMKFQNIAIFYGNNMDYNTIGYLSPTLKRKNILFFCKMLLLQCRSKTPKLAYIAHLSDMLNYLGGEIFEIIENRPIYKK